MKPEEIPQELIDILDARAGRKHSRTGSVVTALAEILTAYDGIRERNRIRIHIEPSGPTPCPYPHFPPPGFSSTIY